MVSLFLAKKIICPHCEKANEKEKTFCVSCGGKLPVVNGKGELIGLAFDGNWEAMSGDIAFEPDLQRCINVDVRYVLWVIDKYAGAGHLIEEMDIRD